MLRQAARALGRQLGRRATNWGPAAATAAGHAPFAHLAAMLSGARRKAASAAAFAGLALSMGTSVSFAAASSPLERSFIMVKPDGVHRGLVGDVIQRFEKKGYKLVGVKVLVPSRELAAKHYEEHNGKPFFPKLVDFLSSGPVVVRLDEAELPYEQIALPLLIDGNVTRCHVALHHNLQRSVPEGAQAMVFEGKEIVKTGRTMIGATSPLASAPGTLRGDYGIDVGRNIIHGSDSAESAMREIALWFNADELAEYTPVSTPWIYE